MATTRRTFLASAAAAGAALPLTAGARSGALLRRQKLRILILGGTSFLGPPFVRAAVANGHEVTLFNRGKTNPDLFAKLEKLRGDRDTGDLDALKGREFDCVVDTSGYVPRQVRATAELFAKTAKVYQFISTISVYRSLAQSNDTIDEQAAVHEVSAEVVEATRTIRQSFAHYGAMKALCEQAAEQAMPGKVCSIRPGLIVGPGDTSDRFSYWPDRVAKGGDVLAPGKPEGRVQFVDVRDVAAWMLHCLEQDVTGVYNCNGFRGEVSMRELLDGCKCATSEPVEFVWVDGDFLLENEVRPYTQMPLWIPGDGRGRVANERAIDKGLTFRPIADTIRDTLRWVREERGDRPWRNGLAAEREKELLAKWRSR